MFDRFNSFEDLRDLGESAGSSQDYTPPPAAISQSNPILLNAAPRNLVGKTVSNSRFQNVGSKPYLPNCSSLSLLLMFTKADKLAPGGADTAGHASG